MTVPPATVTAETVLTVDDLTVEVGPRRSTRTVVDSVSLRVHAGETLGIVGESGSGKTLTVLGALDLLPDGTRATGGRSELSGTDLLHCSARELRSIRGRLVGMVFQDPLTSLHPSIRIGDQLIESLRIHDRRSGRREARARSAALLERVGVPRAADRLDDYPYQWSGGMRQRAMIAMAMAHDPPLIVADEPTTALDVTVQAQILDLLATAKAESGAAVVLISHDLGVIAEAADRVLVMYAGRVVEEAPVEQLFADPRHPYTAALIASVPTLDDVPGDLPVIGGHPPDGSPLAPGCPFEPRCPVGHGDPRCIGESPVLVRSGERRVACHHADDEPLADVP